jgi:hypothetical protein
MWTNLTASPATGPSREFQTPTLPVSRRTCCLQLFRTLYALHNRAYQHCVGGPALNFSDTGGQLRPTGSSATASSSRWRHLTAKCGVAVVATDKRSEVGVQARTTRDAGDTEQLVAVSPSYFSFAVVSDEPVYPCDYSHAAFAPGRLASVYGTLPLFSRCGHLRNNAAHPSEKNSSI